MQVLNRCQIGDQPVDIIGEAAPADPAYGSKGVLRVQFPQSDPPECPGPNYIVQGEYQSATSQEQRTDDSTDYTGDFAIVQASNFSTLFVLSRERNIADDVVDVSSYVAVSGFGEYADRH